MLILFIRFPVKFHCPDNCNQEAHFANLTQMHLDKSPTKKNKLPIYQKKSKINGATAILQQHCDHNDIFQEMKDKSRNKKKWPKTN